MTAMAEDTFDARCARLEAALAEPGAGERLPALKSELGTFVRDIDVAAAHLAQLRDAALRLVEQWKILNAGRPSLAPSFTAERPVVHADHIGASTFVEKGWSRMAMGDPEAAEQALIRALELSPGDPTAESLLGWALMQQDKVDAALHQFQNVLVREPQNSLARVNVGYLCLKQRRFSDAIEHLSRVIRLNNDPKATLYAHFYLGLVYLERDMFEDAQTFFQKTLTLGPNLIEAHFELGRAYWFNGQQEEAVATWTAGHEANRFSPWGKQCAEVLATVRAGGEP
jgi:tetratricopeptide (TPR) repeat protein